MKTAVEWFIDELYKQGISLYTAELIEQAKQMDKEQSECICVNVIDRILSESEQGKEINSKQIFEDVYKETFKK